MSQSQIHGPGRNEDDADDLGPDTTGGGQVQQSISTSDDLLDEIDLVLEENAESFVKSFVQKGGQ
ncbi:MULTISPECIES: ubiquitin-like protein Pup [Helcobacillus]|uniref:Prokaryotic ubiquitin-like protein Pup n=1 Tax=Helcobacillus massiliensis TaxID=521392 RepID=A0A839QQ38_9MICO|nr:MULTISPECIES: ubiquitin-like protein Pup [Helcobacillus]MBB3022444.1 ubiquitin-like protein Pup [Helcobacillus massiliensis]MCG7427343.1 ubiquitin-like protein Pup [Helcobacillus sp. ACRRO]MDK7741149.1 ubiquitin-like protein Pup [Helcobacillus massiliensis]WOO93956.1 ubiquitin-like protein Pup [Helcobacillus massiliensis]